MQKYTICGKQRLQYCYIFVTFLLRSLPPCRNLRNLIRFRANARRRPRLCGNGGAAPPYARQKGHSSSNASLIKNQNTSDHPQPLGGIYLGEKKLLFQEKFVSLQHEKGMKQHTKIGNK